MKPADQPDETTPFVRAFLADRGFSGVGPGRLDLAVHERDEMLGFLADSVDGDPEKARFAYFRSGLSIAGALLEILRWRFPQGPGRVLDFASGYGRITRFLVREIPPERLWVADVYEDGVRFQEQRFGVHGVVSTVRPEDLDLDGSFDAILVTSLFTHLPEERFVAWLRVLLERLAPGGVLVFSTHDPSLLGPRAKIPESGLLFQEVSESGSLDASDYGSSWASEGFVRGALARLAGSIGRSASVHRVERGLCNYQDLYVAVLEPEVDFSGLSYAGEPELFLERFAVAGPDRLEMSGWAAARSGPVQAVEVLLDGRVLADFPAEFPRPDVAGMLGPRFLHAGWGGGVELPPGTSRGASVLLFRVRDGRGVSHLLRAGTVDSLLLESARNVIEVLKRKLRTTGRRLAETRARANAETGGLRARMAAMEASGFWKMRNAWFRLKRGVGLTREP